MATNDRKSAKEEVARRAHLSPEDVERVHPWLYFVAVSLAERVSVLERALTHPTITVSSGAPPGVVSMLDATVVHAPFSDDLAALRLRVEELTHERDQARKLIYGDHESHWGKYHTDEATKPSGGNIGSWYDSAVFWKRRAESAEKAGIKFGEFPDHFVATNARAEKAERELGEARQALKELRQSP